MGKNNKPVTASYSEAEKEVIEHFENGFSLPTNWIQTVALSTNLNFLYTLTSFNSSELNQHLAENSSTPHEILSQFAEDDDSWVRYIVAQNPSTPAEALAVMSRDPNYSVIEAVAQNPNTPAHVLSRLAETDNTGTVWFIRENAQHNPTYLQHRAEQDGMCTKGAVMPVEWLREMYTNQ